MDFTGQDIVVNKVSRIGQEIDHSIILCNPDQMDYLKKINTECLVFCCKKTVVNKKNLSYIISPDPEILFFRFINDFLVNETDYWYEGIISVNSTKYPDVVFGYNVIIGKNVVIAPGTKIGNNSVIGNNVVIRSNVEIGNSCIIKDNSVIGSSGFGFIRTDDGLMQIPQIGFIKIGNDVIIGSCCSIEKPTMGHTIINDNVKIDDLVQVGQNQEIGKNTIITTGFKGETGAKIGSDTFIGMGVTIISGEIEIGNRCIIGAGTVVLKSVPDGKIVYSKQMNEIKGDSGEKIKEVFYNFKKTW
jgi:UDP-3-O-[3-hydroxymyristoyl] glucosamine N-acyltransferase